MDVERHYKLAKNANATEALARVCWNLSDKLGLANGRNSEVGMERTITEQVGNDEYTLAQKETSLHIYATRQVVVIHFAAMNTVDEAKAQERSYKLSTTITDDIDMQDLPPDVRDYILDIDDDEDEDGGMVLDDGEPVDLEMSDLQRSQVVEYEIAEDGDITDYTLTFDYLVDNEVAYSVDFSSGELQDSQAITATSIAAQTLELRDSILLVLTDTAIDEETRDLDNKIEEFMMIEKARTALEFGDQSQDEHARRAMTTFAIFSSGIFDMSKLGRLPKAWQ